jgi:hypothetical protein
MHKAIKSHHVVKTIYNGNYIIEVYSDGGCVLTMMSPGFFELDAELIAELASFTPLRIKKLDMAAESDTNILISELEPDNKVKTTIDAIKVIQSKIIINDDEANECLSPKNESRWSLINVLSNGTVETVIYPSRKLYRIAAAHQRSTL